MNESTRKKFFEGRVILAPMTRGGNLPFRRLLLELGARTMMGEMALAGKLCQEGSRERILLRRLPEEDLGIQLIGRKPAQLARAAEIATEAGASFIDLNAGCPIDLFCRRGMGAALMKRPAKIRDIVQAMREATELPLSVKIRTGWEADKPTYPEIARAAEEAGADAVIFHGRSRKQRYKKAADWDAVARLVNELSIPVIGNGDLLGYADAHGRWETSQCAGIMVGRGALIKPWIFTEIAERRDHLLTPSQRYLILQRYRDLALEHFGNDEKGRRRAGEFLFWHLDFFNRYRPIRSENISLDDHPLIQTRMDPPPPTSDPVEKLLCSIEEEDRRELCRLLMEEIPVGDDRDDFQSLQPGPACRFLED